jgi:hypothetical protein
MIGYHFWETCVAKGIIFDDANKFDKIRAAMFMARKMVKV